MKRWPTNIADNITKLENENIDTNIINNLHQIVEEFQKIDKIDIILPSNIVMRDKECVSIEWPKNNIFIYIYSESIEIDKAVYLNGKVTHNTVEISSIKIKEYFINEFLHKLMD
jgi:hypothetical protein